MTMTHEEARERARFEAWMVNDAKCVVGSSDPYPRSLEEHYWKCWQAATQAAQTAPRDITITIPEADDLDKWVRFESTREGPSERTHITLTAKMLEEVALNTPADATGGV